MNTETKTRALWIDDRIDEIVSLILAVESHGIQVTTARSRDLGLEKCRTSIFDIVITDLLMPPPGHPIELLENIRALLPQAKLVVASGYLENDEYRRTLESLRLDLTLLEKPKDPIEAASFVETIRRLSSKGLANQQQVEASAKAAKETFLQRVADATDLKPGIAGVRIDLKKLFKKDSK